MAKTTKFYGNDSITALKGPDKVRLRPAVIFGASSLEGCQHAMFEILSNSIDEAREGFGNVITVTRYLDNSIEVADCGRGITWRSVSVAVSQLSSLPTYLSGSFVESSR